MHNFTTEQIAETTSKAKELLEQTFKVIFNREYQFSIEDTSQSHDEYEIRCIHDDDILLVVDFTENQPVYYPQGIKHYPGVRYYKDGSGEPPYDEPFDLLEYGTPSVREAVEKILIYVRDIRWQDSMEAFYEIADRITEPKDPTILDEPAEW